MKPVELVEQMAAMLRNGVPFVLATVIEARGSTPREVGAKMIVAADGSIVDTVGGGVLEKHVIEDALAALASGTSRIGDYQLRKGGADSLDALCGGEAKVFLEVHAPARSLVIVGAGHVGQKIAKGATLLELPVTVVDSRVDMVTRERFPDADQLVCGDEGRVSELARLGPGSYVVIVTHSHQLDKAALRSAIESSAPYVGLMGSSTKVRSIYAQLREEGVPEALLEKVRAPIGLDIAAETPGELAISILAQVVAEMKAESAA